MMKRALDRLSPVISWDDLATTGFLTLNVKKATHKGLVAELSDSLSVLTA